MNTPQVLTVDEVKALQDVRRLAARFANTLNAVEKPYFVKAFALSAVALTKVENQVSPRPKRRTAPLAMLIPNDPDL